MNLLNEVNTFIKTSQYLKALKLLLRYEYFDSAEICIKIARRYSYVCNKLLQKYLLKYNKKSHKVKPILYRAFEGHHIWSELIQKEEARQKIFTPRRLSCISISASQKFIHNKNKINKKWLQQEKRLFLQSMCCTLQHHYQYLKLKKETNNALLVLKKIITLSYFQDSLYHLQKKSINNRQNMLMLIGSAYFEQNSMQQSIEHFSQSIFLGLERILVPLFYLKEQLKISQNDRKFQKQVFKTTSKIVASLYYLVLSHELKGEVSEMQNSLSFCNFITNILIYFDHCLELQVAISQLTKTKYDDYKLYFLENGELIRFSKFITNYEDQVYCHSIQNQNFYQQIIQNIPKVQQPSFVVRVCQNEKFENFQSYHKKSNSDATDTTLQSGRQSKCNTEIQFFNDSLGLASISISQQPEHQKFRKLSKITRQPIKQKSGNNFLSKLLQLNEEKSVDNQNLITQVEKKSNQDTFRNLEEEINILIDNRLPSNHFPFDTAQQQCKKLLKQEQEQRKEFPFAYDTLKFKEEFSSGLRILEENIQEFNKHFEFNVLKYFDYLTQSNESAMSNLKYNQNFSKLRLAEQKLIQSRNLVLKKQVETFQQEKEEEKKKENENETQANILLENVQKRKTMLFNIIGSVEGSTQKTINADGKDSINKIDKLQLKMLTPCRTPQNISSEKIKQFSHQKDQSYYANFFQKAQQTIKAQLLESEFLISNKKSVKQVNETPEPLLIKLGDNDDLANSVKHLKAAGFQKLLIKKRNNTKLRTTKI